MADQDQAPGANPSTVEQLAELMRDGHVPPLADDCAADERIGPLGPQDLLAVTATLALTPEERTRGRQLYARRVERNAQAEALEMRRATRAAQDLEWRRRYAAEARRLDRIAQGAAIAAGSTQLTNNGQPRSSARESRPTSRRSSSSSSADSSDSDEPPPAPPAPAIPRTTQRHQDVALGPARKVGAQLDDELADALALDDLEDRPRRGRAYSRGTVPLFPRGSGR